jgi:hypothetical protein
MIFNINIPKPQTFAEYLMFLDNLIGAAEQDLGEDGTDELLCMAITDGRRAVFIPDTDTYQNPPYEGDL